ncbi:MAG: DUF5618 family protein [Bacteroidales bacterium]|jgi:hypothetical protein|nr:DUF5618 family protein [Bacteroidales bacterium]
MSLQEQNQVKLKYYNEAIRYMDNAKETLKNAKKEDNLYRDAKYVKTACGIAYNGILVALDGYFQLKGVSQPKVRRSIEYYQKNLGKLDKKLLDHLNSSYKILHLWGYYDGIENAMVVKSGFDEAYSIIETIKPN